jgi:predicted metal-dependent hydrolase
VLISDTIELGDISIQVTLKAIKHVHLSVHPPLGRVTLVAPTETQLEVACAYAISKLGWIRDQQTNCAGKPEKLSASFWRGKTQYLWGRRYLPLCGRQAVRSP